MRSIFVFVLGLALLLPAATTAHAKDFCFDMQGFILVVPSFKTPKPGTCKPFKKGAYFKDFGAVATGVACTTTIGGLVRVSWTTHDSFNAGSGRIDLAQTTLTGTYLLTTVGEIDGIDTTTGTASAAPCTVATPIP